MKRKELIAATNGKVPDAKYSDLVSSTQSFMLLLPNEITHSGSETSADELILDVDTFTSFSDRTSIRAQTNLPLIDSSNRRSKTTARGLQIKLGSGLSDQLERTRKCFE